MPQQLNTSVFWALNLLVCSHIMLRADSPEKYAVLITASIQEAPAKITLNWEQDPDANANPAYTVFRKTMGDTNWGTGTALGNVLTYVDTGVTIGSAYEYQIVKTTALGYSGYGFVYAGIKANTVPDHRGKLVLVVDNTFTASLATELDRLTQDLAGDGWTVIRHDVVRDDESIPAADLEDLGFGSTANQANAASIRNTIIADYNADPGNVKAVLLFGRVPIFRAGNNDIDGHLPRPVPADGFYGEMDGTWTTATSSLPSDVELMVGRVDLSRMTGKAVWNGPNIFPSELELLRQYLNKDHNFRHGVIDVERQAIIGEGFGEAGGYAFAASGWRNFTPFFGTSKITRAPINTSPGSWQETVCDITNTGTTYLWAHGDGAGAPTGMGALGTRGSFKQVWTRDIVGIDESGNQTPDIKAVFTTIFGSWFGEWDRTDDFMRGVLASRTMGLTASWSGIPHHYYHHMALGETIGHGIRLSQNNDGILYKNQVQTHTRAIHIALMGDPTLRMHVVKPVTNLTASGSGTITLNWTASTDTHVQGYNIYRAPTSAGPFTKITASPVAATTHPDTPTSGTHTYMVRAVKLESSSSGTYLNLSQGAFVTASTTGVPAGNTAPLVGAGTDQSVAFQSVATLSGTVSDNGTTSATWSKVSGPGNVYFNDVNTPATQASFSSIGTYTLRLTGNDGALVTSDDLVITVDPPSTNLAPIVSAGSDQAITFPAVANLSGTVTDETATTNTWSMVNGPGTVTFGDPAVPETTASFSEGGSYTLRLTASDGALNTTDDVVITVNSASPPPAPGIGMEFTNDANTIALYHLNGDYADSSGNGYNLTASGATARTNTNVNWMTSPAGEAARFFDLGDTLTVNIPDSAIMPSAASTISIEARIYIRNYMTDYSNPNASLITLFQDYDAQITVRDSKYHNPPGPEGFGPTQTVAVTSAQWNAAISTDTWHNLLVTFDDNDMITYYLDGGQIGSAVSAPPNVARPTDWTLEFGNFDGELDELRISNTVRTPPQPAATFDAWQLGYFSPSEIQDSQISGQEADPDKDEISNLMEYALDLDPRSLSKDGVVLSKEIVAGKRYLHLQYTRPLTREDISYEPQVSPDLDNWNGNIVEVSTNPNPADQTETVTVRDAISTDDAPRRFIRLNVTWGDPE